MSRSKELVKNTVIIMAGKLFTQFLSLLLLPLYTHTLPTQGYGTVDLIMTYINLLAPIATIQQEMATFRHLIDVRNDKKKQAEVIATSIKSVALRLMIFGVPILIALIFLQLEYAYWALLCGIVMAFSNLFLQMARGFGENLKYAIGSAIAGLITLITSFLLICVFKFGAESILISTAIGNLCCSGYLFFSLKIMKHLRAAKPNKKLRNQMLKYSWPLVPNSISWWLINASDRTIVSIFLGTAVNGVYAVVTRFPAAIVGFTGVFVMSWTESASLHINDKDRDEFFSSVAKNTLQIFSSFSIVLIAAIPLIFDIIIGQEYREAYNYIPIGIVAVLFNVMVSVYSAIYVAKKMTKKVMNTSLISAIINIVVDLILIQFVGLYAAVISTAVAYFAMMIYRHFDIKKYVCIKYRVSDIVMTVLGLTAILPVYYSNNYILYIVGVVLAILYAVTRNWALIRQLAKRIFRR